MPLRTFYRGLAVSPFIFKHFFPSAFYCIKYTDSMTHLVNNLFPPKVSTRSSLSHLSVSLPSPEGPKHQCRSLARNMNKLTMYFCQQFALLLLEEKVFVSYQVKLIVGCFRPVTFILQGFISVVIC